MFFHFYNNASPRKNTFTTSFESYLFTTGSSSVRKCFLVYYINSKAFAVYVIAILKFTFLPFTGFKTDWNLIRWGLTSSTFVFYVVFIFVTYWFKTDSLLKAELLLLFSNIWMGLGTLLSCTHSKYDVCRRLWVFL